MIQPPLILVGQRTKCNLLINAYTFIIYIMFKEVNKKNIKKLNLIIISSLLLVLTAISLLFGLIYNVLVFEPIEFVGFSIDTKSCFVGFITCLFNVLVINIILYFFFKPLEKLSAKNLFWFVILLTCGFLAEIVLCFLLVSYLNIYLTILLATLVLNLYLVLVFLLIFKGGMTSTNIFWEIFRFAIVGALAAVFDFITNILFRYFILNNSGLTDMWISTLAVFFGFVVGVIINYVCSISIVFKVNKEKDFSKKPLGWLLFVLLSAVGLGIGIGLEILLFDICGLSEPISFIIRTLVVLVWNYISRKVFIFKK